MRKLVVIMAAIMMTGCTGANISSQIRESGDAGSSQMIRCLDISSGEFKKYNSELAKYDGWKMVYISEYTTPNKVNGRFYS